jgi:hypothetical protein
MTSSTQIREDDRLLEPELENRKNEIVDALDLERLKNDDAFTRIANAAAVVCQSSSALVTLVGRDHQYTLGSVGTDIEVLERDNAFCTYTIQSDEPLIATEATEDERFAQSSIVQGPPHVRFYAGARYKGVRKTPLGAVCAVDSESRDIDTVAQASLQALASQVERHLMTYLVSQGIQLSDEWFEHTRPRDEQGFALSVEEQARRLSRHITEIQADIMMSRFASEDDEESETRGRMLNWKIDRDIGRAQEKLVGMLEAARHQRSSNDSSNQHSKGLVEIARSLFSTVEASEDVTCDAIKERDLRRLLQSSKSLIVSAGSLEIGTVEIKRADGNVTLTIHLEGPNDALQRLDSVVNGTEGDEFDGFRSELNVMWLRVQEFALNVGTPLSLELEDTGEAGQWTIRF